MPPKQRAYVPRHPTYLRAWREFRDIAAKEAAARLDMDKSSLSRLERGLTPYEQYHLEILAELYKCTPGDLLNADPQLKSDVAMILSAIGRADQPTQQAAVNALKGMLKIK
jgi:transcriptional regulator with XRE-family HTH domain